MVMDCRLLEASNDVTSFDKVLYFSLAGLSLRHGNFSLV
jgi:hypothetical protein